MALSGAGLAPIHTCIIFFSGANSISARCETSDTDPVLLFRQIDAVFMMNFMFSIKLCICMYVVLLHDSSWRRSKGSQQPRPSLTGNRKGVKLLLQQTDIFAVGYQLFVFRKVEHISHQV